jgi:hypothetical protein
MGREEERKLYSNTLKRMIDGKLDTWLMKKVKQHNIRNLSLYERWVGLRRFQTK